MNRERPMGIMLVAIWFFLSGLGYTMTGAGVAFAFATVFGWIGIASTDFQSLSLLYTLLGLVLMATGVGKLVLGWGLLEGRAWARTWGITASGVSVLGWSAIWGVPMAVGGVIFGPLVLLAIVPAIPDVLALFYLLGDEATSYCSDYATASGPLPPTIQTVQQLPPRPTAPTQSPAPTSAVSASPISFVPPPDPPLQKTEVRGARPPAMAWVAVEQGRNRGVREDLHQDQALIIGRDGAQCALVLDDHVVSGQHAQIRYEHGRFFLFDLASTNGTFLNGKRIQRQGMIDGDRIKIGDTVLVFKEAGRGGSQ